MRTAARLSPGQGFHDLVGDVEVGVDLLDVVVVFQGVQEPEGLRASLSSRATVFLGIMVSSADVILDAGRLQSRRARP